MVTSTEEEESTEDMNFSLLNPPATSMAPRLARLALKGRNAINTPHYVAITSRGVVPHLSQDMVKKHTTLRGAYVALEDFIEKAPDATPDLLSQPHHEDGESPLRNFIALPQDELLILGPRRTPPVPCPTSNTHTTLQILTSVGFRQLKTDDCVHFMLRLKPDIVVGLGDIAYGDKPGQRRIDKMSERTERWTRELVEAKRADNKLPTGNTSHFFAPILPISREIQCLYLELLASDMQSTISGLAIYSADSLADLPEPLISLPRLSFTEPSTPHILLREIHRGIDIFTIPFINAATDAGIALDFQFPAPPHPPALPNPHTASSTATPSPPKPLGIDMWLPEHTTNLSPLHHNCKCYTCTTHHRAYLQHLLSAKEMLAWVLLQVHNLRIMDAFFSGVRDSIGTGSFEKDRDVFRKVYEAELPEKTGQGPRVRGYQYKSEGPGEVKRNPLAYRLLDEKKNKDGDAPVPSPNADAKDLEEMGFAATAEREREKAQEGYGAA